METKRVMFRTHNDMQIGDMVVIEGRHHVVWEWNGNEPAVTSPLDPAHLQMDPEHLPPGIDAAYGQEVQDPRKLQ